MAKELKTSEIYDLISYRLPNQFTQKVVERVIKEFKLLIVEELRRTGRIKIDGIGILKAEDYGGKDVLKGNFIEGVTIKTYVEKRKAIRFTPSSILEDCVNQKIVTKKGRTSINKSKNTKYIKKFESDGMEDKFSVDELLDRRLIKKGKKQVED